jgi:hypothetical protein
VASQVACALRPGELAGGRRQQHLTTVSGGTDAGSDVNVEADVPLVGEQRFAGVQADANAHGAAQRGLRVARRGHRVGCPLKHHEEGVTLSIDLHAVVAIEHRPQCPPVLRQRLWVRLLELVQQRRGSGDVGEHQGHGAGGQRRHAGEYPARDVGAGGADCG